jgi:hypothetical protein
MMVSRAVSSGGSLSASQDFTADTPSARQPIDAASQSRMANKPVPIFAETLCASIAAIT